MFHKKGVLEISKNSQENTCARDSFLIKLQACNFILKRGLWHRFFPVNFAKFLRTHLGCLDQTGHTHFWPCPPKNFWLTFNLHKFVSTCKKSGYFIDLFGRYDWLKNSAIRLAEGVLAHISRTKTFPNMWFVLEHRK